MAFGFGPGSEMLKNYNQNRGKLGTHKKEKDVDATLYKKNKIKYGKADPELLEKIKEKKRQEKNNQAILFLIITLVVILLLLF